MKGNAFNYKHKIFGHDEETWTIDSNKFVPKKFRHLFMESGKFLLFETMKEFPYAKGKYKVVRITLIKGKQPTKFVPKSVNVEERIAQNDYEEALK